MLGPVGRDCWRPASPSGDDQELRKHVGSRHRPGTTPWRIGSTPRGNQCSRARGCPWTPRSFPRGLIRAEQELCMEWNTMMRSSIHVRGMSNTAAFAPNRDRWVSAGLRGWCSRRTCAGGLADVPNPTAASGTRARARSADGLSGTQGESTCPFRRGQDVLVFAFSRSPAADAEHLFLAG